MILVCAGSCQVDVSKADYMQQLQLFCCNQEQPVVLIRNLCQAVDLDLNRFSSVSLNECSPYHTIDVREQVSWWKVCLGMVVYLTELGAGEMGGGLGGTSFSRAVLASTIIL